MLLNNVIALARTATISAYRSWCSRPPPRSTALMSAIRAAIPEVVAIDRRNMNMWEDDAARGAIVSTGRRKLIFSGLLTEACVTFPVLSALAAGTRYMSSATLAAGSLHSVTTWGCDAWKLRERSPRCGSRCFWSFKATGTGMRPTMERERSWRLMATAKVSAWPMRAI